MKHGQVTCLIIIQPFMYEMNSKYIKSEKLAFFLKQNETQDMYLTL